METLSYGTFSQQLHQRVLSEHIPLTGTIEVTRRCPLQCAHCYNNLPMHDAAARRGELTLDEHRRIIDQIAEAGCLWLLYTGGEIFARRDFLDIYAHAKHAGLLVTLFTNGTLVTPAIADALAALPPFSIEITLYGHTAATYERLTGVPGSHAKCLRGIRLLMERGLPLKLKTVAVTLNKHEVGAMQRFARELGVEFKFDAMMNPRIDCSQSPLAVRLSPQECVAFDLADDKRMAEWQLFIRQSMGPVHTPAEADSLYHCGGGLNAFAIDPHGGLSICVLSQQDKFDLRKGSFDEGWRRFLRQVRGRHTTRTTKCTRCELKAMCGMCPANGELEAGDPEEPVDFLCQVAHLRAQAFGIGVPEHGDCEYCAGGARHEALLHSAAGLDQATRALGSAARPRTIVPLVALGDTSGQTCATGACGSCGCS